MMDRWTLIYYGIFLGIGVKVGWVLWEYSVKLGAYLVDLVIEKLDR